MQPTSLIHFRSAPPSDSACEACQIAKSSIMGVKLQHLRESAGSGCQECRLRYLGVIQAVDDEPSRDSMEIFVKFKGSLTRIRKCWDRRIDANTSVYFYTNFGEAKSTWSTVGVGRTTSPRKTTYAAIIQAWLRACDESHTECRKSRDNWYEPHAKCPEPREEKLPKLPTRILDVESTDPNVIKVKEIADEKGPYIALSHCWGGNIAMKTTRANFRTRQRDIRFDALPKNFQDAVAVTRAAGLRYLWIDALCILQNDKEDWEKESGRMAAVYQNAHFVLGADMSTDSHGGFLDTEECGYERRETPVATFGGEKYTIYARHQYGLHFNPCPMFTPIQTPANGKDRNPLRDRAWALQEQFLASRMVHFTEKEMIWECRSALWCACGELDMDISAEYERLPYYESLVSDSTNKFRIWYRIVNAIGNRDITKEADLLPALSGLAHQFQRQGAGTYLAGIWENDLPQGLLWARGMGSRPTRANPYRAPSWSWASIGNEIGRYDSSSGHTDFKARLEHVYAKIRDAKCVADGKDPLGAVAKDQCYLKVYGPLMELVYQGSDHWGAPNNACQMEPPQLYNSDFDLKFNPDREESLYCLYIGDLTAGPEDFRCKGLILRQYKISPHPEFEEAFERIGSFGHKLGTVEKFAQFIEMREVVIF